MKRIPKTTILIVSLAIAVGVSALMPTPNNVNGGTAKMLLIIFGTVFFKVLIEWVWQKAFRK